MKRFYKCFKGECSRPREDGVDSDHPHGYNEFLNYIVRHKIIPKDGRRRDLRASYRILGHPIFSGRMFEWQAVLNGTQNRADANFLGKGNFGLVYRCDLPNCNTVGAAKFQDEESQFGHDEFITELSLLERANHPNVIKLLGTSFGRNKLALIYEFMPRGSLDHHLLKISRPVQGLPQNHPVLKWELRMRIALGVAEALAYLHKELKMIHRDVKIQNVLLDQDLVPKLTDFGLAVKTDEAEDGSEVQKVALPLKGTPGCVAPETEIAGLVSTKADVYGYGVLLFQLFTAMKAYDSREPHETRRISHWMREKGGGEKNLPNVIDAKIRFRFSVEGLNCIFETARKCTSQEIDERPNMEQVVTMVGQAAAYAVPPVGSGLRKSRSI